MDCSQYIFQKAARSSFANYAGARKQIEGGCGSVGAISGSDSSSFSMAALGGVFTTPDEYDVIEANYECPVVIVDEDGEPIVNTQFTPENVGSLKAWFDATDLSGTVDDTAITSWTDRSGNGHNAGRVGTVAGPKFYNATVSSGAYLKFNDDATSRVLNAGNILNTQDFSVFVVGKYNECATGAHYIVSGWKKEFPSLFAINNNAIYVLPGSETDIYVRSRTLTSAYTCDTTKPHIFSASVRSNADGTVLVGGLDGIVKEVRNKTENMTGDVGRGFIIGGSVETPSNTVKYTSNTNINEIIIFEDNLSDEVRQKVEGYLAHKWGLTANLPADHHWKAVAP
jgi:hypothetical protein